MDNGKAEHSQSPWSPGRTLDPVTFGPVLLALAR